MVDSMKLPIEACDSSKLMDIPAPFGWRKGTGSSKEG
jgi:hypothetical protein